MVEARQVWMGGGAVVGACGDEAFVGKGGSEGAFLFGVDPFEEGEHGGAADGVLGADCAH